MKNCFLFVIVSALCIKAHAVERLVEGDRQKIEHMIKPLASWSLIRLGINRKEIERRGEATSGIPVMQALSYLFSVDGCRADMEVVRKSSLKWNSLAKGYADRLEHEHSIGALLPVIDDFAKELGADPSLLRSLVEKGDFVGLFNAL
ncbi:MAG: hypothetical protein KDK50_06155 [Chlamydiia bacterium]|nr:hypothetical protein [Chlamydiia bacterium]MCP5492367.1 hypothetical protein [Chlamydiales bacterium]